MNTIEEINAVGFLPRQDVANILVALKLTWWVTNHHAGQNKQALQGFINKVATMAGVCKDGKCCELTRTILWAAAKYLSIISILMAIGILNLDVTRRAKLAHVHPIDITVAREITLRVKSNPAGTAKNITYLAAARDAVKSVYTIAMPSLSG